MTAIVEARGLVKRYHGNARGRRRGPRDRAGEIFGLVGPNGAGKTTMLRMLATLLVPTSGDALIAGESVRRNPQAVRRVIGYMPDAFGVYDDMKVWEYLDFFGRCYGLGPAQRKRMIGDLLELVDLAAKRDAYVLSLSRGMQQRSASPMRSSTTRRCSCSTSRPRASIPAPASSSASCSASSGRWARRS